MGSPIPHVVVESGDVASAPPGAIPVSMFSDQAGGGETWQTLPGKPAVIAAGADQAAARTSIGAGTSSLAIGTTASTAKAGNYTPTYAEVTGKPATFAPTIGSTASTAAAGNHNHPVTADSASGLAAAASIQALAVALSARIKSLEDATP